MRSSAFHFCLPGVPGVGELASRILEQFRAEFAPLAAAQRQLTWESWKNSTTAPLRTQPEDMPEWLCGEIAHGSF